MIMFALLAKALVRVVRKIPIATNAKELAVIQNNTGIATMTNWPFPSYPPTAWTAKQIKEHAQQKRAQLPESPL
jgi:hypothetical protein